MNKLSLRIISNFAEGTKDIDSYNYGRLNRIERNYFIII